VFAISRLPDKKWSKTHLRPGAKPKIFPGVIPPDPRLKRREWEKVGRGGKGSAERGEEGKGEEGREWEEEGGWGEYCFMLSGGIDATVARWLNAAFMIRDGL
jgi:hypothetical protein